MMRFLLLIPLLPGCTLLTGYLNPISCGDGLVSPQNGEECDDGEDNDNAPDACRVDCALPACGDGILDNNPTIDSDDNGFLDVIEECDDGDANSDTTPDACRLDCQAPSCGDGVLDLLPTLDLDNNGTPETTEACDDGNDIDNDSCDNTCQTP